jgi:membrane-associated phospholipid phosphatase
MLIKNIFDIVGSISPIILFFTSLFFLRNLKKYLLFYVFGFGLNNILNAFLKIVIQEPRPKDDKRFIELFTKNGVRFGADRYGMPSGHAQNCAYSLLFITFSLNDPNITLFYSIMTLISVIQRYEYNNHTIIQLIVGLCVGFIFAYFIFFLANTYIFGKLTNKKDDNFFSRYI